MIENNIAKRYARALISVAKDTSAETVDAFAREPDTFQAACAANEALIPTLANPHFDLFARERIIDTLSQKMGLSDNVKKFLKLLVHKSRMNLFSFVCDEYHALANDIMGRVVMTVVSAVDLPEAQYQTLQSLFGKVTGKDMVVKRRTDPDVLGGIRVHVKDKVYDYTVANQLEKMKQSMLG